MDNYNNIIPPFSEINKCDEDKYLFKFITKWFQYEKIWFSKNINEEIKADNIINKISKHFFENEWMSYIHNNINKYTITGECLNNIQYLAYTILLDQCNRHIYRNSSNLSIYKKKTHNDYMARLLCTTKLFPFNTYDTTSATKTLLNNFEPKEIVFLLLPLRHGYHKDDFFLNCVFNIITKLINENLKHSSNINPYFKRFYRATLKQLTNFNSTLFKDKNLPHTIIINNNIKLQKNTKTRLCNKIINCQDITKILDNKCKYINQNHFMNLLNNTIQLTNNDSEYWYKYFIHPIKKYITQTSKNTLVISVSGGVDSMVLLISVIECFRRMKINNINCNIKNISVVHINYMNRETSNLEGDMVHQFINYLNDCHIMPIKYYQRNITEVTRDNCISRDIYEDITRDIRFKMYCISSQKDEIIVVLGHNKDDCQENIWNNIIKQQSYNNLKGMETISYEKNIQLFRPFLSISKQNIYTIANILKIPYLYDSTPNWSERGKQRDILFPFLEKYDSRIIIGMDAISNTFQEMYTIYKLLAKNSIVWNDKLKQINININILQYPIQVFKECLLQSVNIIKTHINIHFCITNKCINSTYKNILSSINTINKFTLNTNIDTGKCLKLYYINNKSIYLII